ncbi:MlaD family protein [Mycolicibacterium sp. A43C]
MRLVRAIACFTAFAVIIGVAVTYIASFKLPVGLPEERTTLSMEVPDVKGLVVGSSVLLRGVSVGKVTAVRSERDAASIEFYIEGDRQIPVDSDVRLDNLSALGEAYVGFVPRTDSGPMLYDGQRIAAEYVRVPPSISELATSVVRVLNQMDPEQLKSIVGEADAALPDPQLTLPNLARTSVLLRNTANGMNGDGKVVLDHFQTLLENAGWVGPTIADIGPPLRDAGVGVSSTIKGMMNVIVWNNPDNVNLFQKYLDRVQGFLDDRAPDVKVITEALMPRFQGISGALMNFDSGQMLANMLAGIPEEGAITLHVAVPDK